MKYDGLKVKSTTRISNSNLANGYLPHCPPTYTGGVNTKLSLKSEVYK